MITFPTNKLQKVLLGGGCEQGNVPSGYTQVEYLESTGTQYIDTGYKPNANTSINVKFYPSVSSNFMCVYGTQDSATKNRFYGLVSSTQFKIQVNSNAANSPNYWGLNKDSTFTINNNGTFAETQCIIDLTIDNINKKISIKSDEYTGDISLSDTIFGNNLNCNYTMLLFSRSSASVADNNFYGRIYGFSIKDNGVIIQNLIPARRNSDNVLGMYDTVSGTFLTNAGTDTFTAGADVVPTPNAPIDIVCNNGVLKVSKNLLDVNNIEGNFLLTDLGQIGNDNSAWFTTNFIKVAPNTEYCFDFISSEDIQYRRICGYSSNNYNSFTELLVKKAKPTVVGTRYTITFTTSTTTNYIKLSSYVDDTNSQIVEGSTATPYHPFGIYTDGTVEQVTDNLGNTANAERLLAVGTYKDTQEVLNGTITKRIGIAILDGTETWNKSGTYTGSFYANNINPSDGVKVANISNVLCSHGFKVNSLLEYSSASIGAIYWYSPTTINYKYDNGTATVEQFKQYLADQYANGTPVIIVYPLATPTTDQVTPQPLAGSSATITAGSIANLPIESSTIAELKKRYIGNNEVKRVYIGNNLVYNN